MNTCRERDREKEKEREISLLVMIMTNNCDNNCNNNIKYPVESIHSLIVFTHSLCCLLLVNKRSEKIDNNLKV